MLGFGGRLSKVHQDGYEKADQDGEGSRAEASRNFHDGHRILRVKTRSVSPMSSHDRFLDVPLRRLLVGMGRSKECLFFEGPSDQLEADRQTCLGESAGN